MRRPNRPSRARATALTHRLARRVTPVTVRLLPSAMRPGLTTRLEDGPGHPQWLRDVMTPDTRRCFGELGPETLDAVEISGDAWRHLSWRRYEQLDFPEFDLCAPPRDLPGPFGLVICEQVLE